MTHAVDSATVSAPAGPIVEGTTWGFQAWFRDTAAGGAQFNLSEALAISFES